MLMKNVLKHILTLSLLLFCSYAHLSAFVFVDTMYAASETKSEIKLSDSYSNPRVSLQLRTSTPFQKSTKEKAVVPDNDEEDVEYNSSKKQTNKACFSISVFNQPITTFCTFLSKKTIAFSAFASYTRTYNSPLYLLFEVFRI